MDGIIRLSNEFKFPIAGFHHAMETYLIPETLKNTWGGTPTVAMFATLARTKREQYRHSEFAPKILSEHGIPVVMKSDHDVLNSRHLIFEAQQAHYYGLDADLALASVTSTPAKTAGLGHRVGILAEGYDADVVLWDSHPLTLGATPVQVWIDGIAQLVDAEPLHKPKHLQEVPKAPNWDHEAEQAVLYDGLPPLRGRKVPSHSKANGGVRFVNMTSMWLRDDDGDVYSVFDLHDETDYEQVEGESKRVSTREMVVTCDGLIAICAEGEYLGLCGEEVEEVVDLQHGSIAPGLTTFGSPIGLEEIELESSTNDGFVPNPLKNKVPDIIGGDETAMRAADGLQFGGRNMLLAYRSGVTRAVTAPVSDGFLSGLSATIDTGAVNALEKGAIVEDETAMHVAVSLNFETSVSTQIAVLRRLLEESSEDAWRMVRSGDIPLVIRVESADVMATLISLKEECEDGSWYNRIRMTFVGASEAHLLAKKIKKAGISVVLTSPRPFPQTWEKQRIVPGPPLTKHDALSVLLEHGVNVAIGTDKPYEARNARFDIAWAQINSRGKLSRTRAIKLASTNLERALGARLFTYDLVAYRGGTLFDFESKVAGVVSLRRRTFDKF